jgi:glycosyltransferase involved in cell wall biosynthesis
MPRLLRVAALTGGAAVPSARFRVGQYVGPLRDQEIDLRWYGAPISNFPPSRRWLRPLWLPASLAARVPAVVATRSADITLLQRELVSTISSLEAGTRSPRIFDVDDAIWLRRGGEFAARIARGCALVIAGNDFIAEWFSGHCPRTVVLPTAVDTERFRPRDGRRARDCRGEVVIGWSGTSSNFGYLHGIEASLKSVLQARPGVRLSVCADKPPRLGSLPPGRVDFVPWSQAAEVRALQDLDIGIMPLQDDDWTRGKCSYKMLLYMSCGKPVVVSPVGMNATVLSQAAVGIGADDQRGWVDGLTDLIDDVELRSRYGSAGRALVLSTYSLDVLAPRLASLIKDVADG